MIFISGEAYESRQDCVGIVAFKMVYPLFTVDTVVCGIHAISLLNKISLLVCGCSLTAYY